MKNKLVQKAFTTVLFGLAGVVTFAQTLDTSVTTHDGLVRVNKAKSGDEVYLHPAADLGSYDSIILMEAHVAFRKGWISDYNSGASPFDRLSKKDADKMIQRAKDLFNHTFGATLEKNGYQVVKESGESVLVVRPSIIDLEVTVPDPNKIKGMGRSKTYARGAGSATFVLELYDSLSMQILARSVEDVEDHGDPAGWRFPRDYATNMMDARSAFDYWARQLVGGLKRAKAASAVE